MSRRDDQRIWSWPQLKGSTLPYYFDFRPFANRHNLTVDTVSSESDNVSIATVAKDVVADGEWAGEITAVQCGTADITLTCTFTGSTITRVRKFIVDVTDPDH